MNEFNLNYSPEGHEEMEKHLWEYIDNQCKGDNKATIEKLLSENRLWQDKYNELMLVHQLIQSSDMEQPSLRFTRNVMEEIAKHHIAPATRDYINKKIIWSIAAFFITVIVGFLIYALAQVDWSTGYNTTKTMGINFSQVDYSKMFSNTYINIFIMLNIILALLLLDRYLSEKKRKLFNEIG